MTSIEVVPLQHSPARLPALAAVANEEHRAVENAVSVVMAGVTEGVAHAIRAGEALLAARALVPDGQWEAWVSENIDYAVDTVKKYSRLAAYRSEVEQWMAEGGQGGILDAWRALRGLPAVASSPGEREAWQRQEAIDRHGEGESIEAIAKSLGTSWGVVKTWVDPAYRAERQKAKTEQRRRRKAAAKALAQQERDQEIKKIGGNVADAYASVRKATASLDRAMREAVDADEREMVRLALSSAYKCEDQIVQSLRLGRRIS